MLQQSQVKPFLLWVGSKRTLARFIVPLIPPHHTYVEPFGGSAAVLLAKPPSPVEIYNDIDDRLVNLFRVVRDEEKCKRLEELLRWTLLSRSEKRLATRKLKRGDWRDEVEYAYLFLVHVMQSFGATGRSWRISKLRNSALPWCSLSELLEPVRQRLQNVAIEQNPWQYVLETYDSPQTCFYLDPPYHPETCPQTNEYAFGMTRAEHQELVEKLLNIQGSALLSGYFHEDYLPLERAGWVRHELQVSCRLVPRTRERGLQGIGALDQHGVRIECVWVRRNGLTDGQISLPLES